MSEQIPRVNPDDLRIVWNAWPALQEQAAGGLTIAELQKRLSPGADVHVLAAHCIALQERTRPGEVINFEEAAKAIPLPVR